MIFPSYVTLCFQEDEVYQFKRTNKVTQIRPGVKLTPVFSRPSGSHFNVLFSISVLAIFSHISLQVCYTPHFCQCCYLAVVLLFLELYQQRCGWFCLFVFRKAFLLYKIISETLSGLLLMSLASVLKLLSLSFQKSLDAEPIFVQKY